MARDLEGSELLRCIRTKVGKERQRALETLLENWEPWIVVLARRYSSTHSDVHDYQQIARLALLRAVERFVGRPGSGFEWFARRVLRNALVDEAVRDGRRRRRQRYYDVMPDEVPARTEAALDRLLRQETSDLVRQEMRRWSERLQEIADLLFRQDHKQSDVARILGRTPARVSQLMREIRSAGEQTLAALADAAL